MSTQDIQGTQNRKEDGSVTDIFKGGKRRTWKETQGSLGLDMWSKVTKGKYSAGEWKFKTALEKI